MTTKVLTAITLAAVAALLVLAACDAAASPAPSPTPTGPPRPATTLPPLSVGNETTIAVTIVVNGTVVTTVGPGAVADPIGAALPALPWSVEARSPGGRVLSTLTVASGDGISSTSGRGARADLACGRLDIWSGPPMLGPVFSPDPTRPCD